MKTFHNYIAGAWVEPSTGKFQDNTNPADTSDVIGRFPLSASADVARAVESAQRGFELWKRTPAPARGDVLRRVGEIMIARKEELADLMTREMGKPLAETRGDVQEGIDTAFYAATEGRRLFGHTVPSELRNKWAMSFRRPIGVAGIITPFNFPLAIPTWKIFPALVCGNAVVFKPGEDVPHTGHVFVEILLEAGLPPEVIQLVHGDGLAGAAMVEHPGIALVSFTGSTDTGSKVGETCGRLHKRLTEPVPPLLTAQPVSAQLQGLHADLLDREPLHRPAHAGEVRDRLRELPECNSSTMSFDRSGVMVSAGSSAYRSSPLAASRASIRAPPPRFRRWLRFHSLTRKCSSE